jgi:hypothetical protein
MSAREVRSHPFDLLNRWEAVNDETGNRIPNHADRGTEQVSALGTIEAENARAYLKHAANSETPPLEWKKSRSR